MRTKDQINFLEVLNDNLRQNDFYNHLFTKISDYIDEVVGEKTSRLYRARSAYHIKRGDYIKDDNGELGRVANIERIVVDGEFQDDITIKLNNGVVTQRRKAIHDKTTLINGSIQLGFDYYSDYLNEEDYSRIFDYISQYWPKGGLPEFIKFIGYIKNIELEMFQLWTEDQGDNANSDDPTIQQYSILERFNVNNMSPIWEGGMNYPTSHVEIEYNALSGDGRLEDFVHLFYYLAPIHLVLERIVASINSNIDYYYAATVQYNEHTSSNFSFDTNSNITLNNLVGTNNFVSTLGLYEFNRNPDLFVNTGTGVAYLDVVEANYKWTPYIEEIVYTQTGTNNSVITSSFLEVSEETITG